MESVEKKRREPGLENPRFPVSLPEKHFFAMVKLRPRSDAPRRPTPCRPSTTSPEQPSPGLVRPRPRALIGACAPGAPIGRHGGASLIPMHLPTWRHIVWGRNTSGSQSVIYARQEAAAGKTYSRRRRETHSQMKFDGMQLLSLPTAPRDPVG